MELLSSEDDSCLKESCCVLTVRQLLVSLLLASKKSPPSNADRWEIDKSKWVAPLRQLSSKSGLHILLLPDIMPIVNRIFARWYLLPPLIQQM